MKKKRSDLSRHLSPVKLFLNDIEEIITIIQSVCPEVNIANRDYEFESFEELKENSGHRLKELKISGHSTVLSNRSYVSLDIKKYDIFLYSGAESEAVVGVWYTLKEFLQKKAGWISRFLNAVVWFWIFWIWLLISVILLETTKKYIEVHNIVEPFAIIALGAAFLFLLLSLLKHWRGSIIYLERKHKVSNFWERNRDNIITGLIGAIIGATITLAGQFLIKSISK